MSKESTTGRMLWDLVLPRILERAASGGDGSLAWMHNYHTDWYEKVAAA